MAALEAIQQPRSDYQLQHFVVGEKDTSASQYAQCVLEMQIKYDAIRVSQCDIELLSIDIEDLEAQNTPRCRIEARKKRIAVESVNRAMLGAIREFACLYRIFKSFGRTYTYDELQADAERYWLQRLQRESVEYAESEGRIPYGHWDALRQIGVRVQRGRDGFCFHLAAQGSPAVQLENPPDELPTRRAL